MTCTTAGSAAALARAARSCCTMSSGVPAGTNSPDHCANFTLIARLLEARHLGQRRQRPVAPVRERAQLAGLDLLHHGRRPARDRVDLPAEQRRRRPVRRRCRGCASCGSRPRSSASPSARASCRSCPSCRSCRRRACVLRVGDELRQRLPRRVGAHDQHRRVGGEARDRLELVQSGRRACARGCASASGRIEIDDRLSSTV